MPFAESTSAIDPSALQSLSELGGPELVVEIIDIYLADSPGQLAAIVEAGRGADLDALGRSAHGLKSSSVQLGAVALAALCGEIEASCQADAAPQATAAVPDIVAAHAAAVERFGELRDAASIAASTESAGAPDALAS